VLLTPEIFGLGWKILASISRSRRAGVRMSFLDHLGIQAEDEAELGQVYGRQQAAEGPSSDYLRLAIN
jgi:hypothetical protein